MSALKESVDYMMRNHNGEAWRENFEKVKIYWPRRSIDRTWLFPGTVAWKYSHMAICYNDEGSLYTYCFDLYLSDQEYVMARLEC